MKGRTSVTGYIKIHTRDLSQFPPTAVLTAFLLNNQYLYFFIWCTTWFTWYMLKACKVKGKKRSSAEEKKKANHSIHQLAYSGSDPAYSIHTIRNHIEMFGGFSLSCYDHPDVACCLNMQ